MSAHAGTIAVTHLRFTEVINMTVEEIMREALTLDAETRASIAHELLSSLESLSDAEVERLWIAEAKRRSADVRAGCAQTLSAQDSLARARANR